MQQNFFVGALFLLRSYDTEEITLCLWGEKTLRKLARILIFFLISKQSWNDGRKWSLWFLRGKDYAPVNQVIDFRANEVEKHEVSKSIYLIIHF